MRIIVKRFPIETPHIVLRPIADVHTGAKECMEREFGEYLKRIEKDDSSYIVLAGDLINNGIKSSVTNVYEEKYPPDEQKSRMVDWLYPVRHKILCWVDGNHERRTFRETGIDVSRGMARELGIEDVYAGSMGFLKISLGKKRDGKPATYMFAVAHGAGGGRQLGSGLKKPDDYQSIIEGVDGMISGHTHQPLKVPSTRIVFDPRNNTVRRQNNVVFVCTSWLDPGGYQEDMLIKPAAFHPDTITLYGDRKEWS